MINKEFGLIGCTLCAGEDSGVHYFSMCTGELTKDVARVYDHFTRGSTLPVKHQEVGLSKPRIRSLLQQAVPNYESEKVSYAKLQEKVHHAETFVWGVTKKEEEMIPCSEENCFSCFKNEKKLRKHYGLHHKKTNVKVSSKRVTGYKVLSNKGFTYLCKKNKLTCSEDQLFKTVVEDLDPPKFKVESDSSEEEEDEYSISDNTVLQQWKRNVLSTPADLIQQLFQTSIPEVENIAKEVLKSYGEAIQDGKVSAILLARAKSHLSKQVQIGSNDGLSKISVDKSINSGKQELEKRKESNILHLALILLRFLINCFIHLDSLQSKNSAVAQAVLPLTEKIQALLAVQKEGKDKEKTRKAVEELVFCVVRQVYETKDQRKDLLNLPGAFLNFLVFSKGFSQNEVDRKVRNLSQMCNNLKVFVRMVALYQAAEKRDESFLQCCQLSPSENPKAQTFLGLMNVWMGCWKPLAGGATTALKTVDVEKDYSLVYLSPSNYLSVDILRIVVENAVSALEAGLAELSSPGSFLGKVYNESFEILLEDRYNMAEDYGPVVNVWNGKRTVKTVHDATFTEKGKLVFQAT